MATIQINGVEYQLACNLRVAYVLQNQHNHEAYSSILARVGEMPIEQQIDVLYAAFQIGNPDTAKTFTKEMFRMYVLDHNEFTATVLLNLIKEIVAGILGRSLDDVDASADNADSEQHSDDEAVKN